MKRPHHSLNFLTYLTLLSSLTLLTFSSCSPTTYHRDLSGTWKFRIDSLDQGISQKWFAETFPTDTVHLPGSLAENGKGFPVTVKQPGLGRSLTSRGFRPINMKSTAGLEM